MRTTCLLLILFSTIFAKAQKPDSVYNFNYEPGIPAWVNFYRTYYTYNTQGKPVQVLNKTNNGLGFENYLKTDYTYNVDGNIAEAISQQWDNTLWKNEEKSVFLYNFLNKVSEIELYTYNPDSSAWLRSALETYTYTVQGDLTEKIIMQYNADSGSYYNLLKIEYSYNALHQEIENNSYIWNDTVWTEFEQYYTSYDALGRADTVLFGIPGILANRYINTYYQNTDTITTVVFQDNSAGTGFVNWNKHLHILNPNLTTDTLYTIYADGNTHNWMPPLYFDKYFYSATPITEQLEPKVTLYPNPVANSLKIDFGGSAPISAAVQVFDMAGKRVLQSMYNEYTGLDVYALQQGRYYMHITTPQGAAVVPFIKQ